MPRSKAQYKAPLTFTEVVTESLRAGVEPKVRDFSPALHGHLRKLYASKARSERASSAWQCPKCQFIEEILGAVRFAFAELDYQRSATNKGDTKAEQENLTKRLRASINKIKKKPNVARVNGFADLAHDLRRISHDLYRLLEVDADPRSCAGVLERLVRELTDTQIPGIHPELMKFGYMVVTLSGKGKASKV